MNFISYDKFTAGLYPPSSKLIQELFLQAEQSPLNAYQFSNVERYERELQSFQIEKKDIVSFDWTFQTIKNYNLPGAKCMFTGNKGSTKEITLLGIVPSTAVRDVSHMLLQAREKSNKFQSGVLYIDTCPNNNNF